LAFSTRGLNNYLELAALKAAFKVPTFC
jgi:hypothetical protein